VGCPHGFAERKGCVLCFDAPTPVQQAARCPVNRNCQGCAQCEPPAAQQAEGEGFECRGCLDCRCELCAAQAARGYAQAERDVVAWLRGDWPMDGLTNVKHIADAIERGAHRGRGTDGNG
jgi:hypothetical protein